MGEFQDLASERVIHSAPMSFSGSVKRIWRLTEGDHGSALTGKIGLIVVAITLIAVAWCLVAAWYCLCLLFFIPFIIFRLFRRSARKNKAAQLRHQEMLVQMQQSVSEAPRSVEDTGTPSTQLASIRRFHLAGCDRLA